MYKLDLKKTEEPEIKLPTFKGSWRRHGHCRKIPTSVSMITLNPLTTNSGKFLKEMGVNRPPELPPQKPVCRSRTNRTRHGTMGWFKIGKGVYQGCTLAPCLLNLYAEYIMCNTELDESNAGIKTVWKNINNHRYADDITLIAESKKELKSLLMKVKEESEKAYLKFNIQKTMIMATSPITSWQTEGEKVETVTDFTFLGSKITGDGYCSHKIKRCLLTG